MSLLILYAHFHPDATVSEHTFYTLNKLKKAKGTLCFVSSSPIQDQAVLSRLKSLCSEIVFCENIGYDFYSWKQGVNRYRNEIGSHYTEVLFINSSIIGPFYGFKTYLRRLMAVEADLTGAILSFQIERHIQSFLFLYHQKILKDPAFLQFWDSIVPINDRQKVIDTYEFGLTRFFEKAGFTVSGLYHGNDRRNHTIRSPFRLFFHGCPFVKIKLLTPQRLKNNVILFRLVLRLSNWWIPRLPDFRRP
ncbi:MAG: hypothetical protein J0L62_13185 [Bacteroidetes bacterium]|nr:hypothetical protein [Bacteroidota bacterium]